MPANVRLCRVDSTRFCRMRELASTRGETRSIRVSPSFPRSISPANSHGRTISVSWDATIAPTNGSANTGESCCRRMRCSKSTTKTSSTISKHKRAASSRSAALDSGSGVPRVLQDPAQCENRQRNASPPPHLPHVGQPSPRLRRSPQTAYRRPRIAKDPRGKAAGVIILGWLDSNQRMADSKPAAVPQSASHFGDPLCLTALRATRCAPPCGEAAGVPDFAGDEFLCWGGWIRTNAWRIQSPLPYRLATPQWRRT